MRAVGRFFGVDGSTMYRTDAGEFFLYLLPRGAWLCVWQGSAARFASRREAVEAIETITRA